MYVFNRDTFLRGHDPHRLFAALDVADPGHAFYLGRELERAALAVRLGKKYTQESPLRWGYLSAGADEAEPVVTRAIGIDPGTVSFDVCGRDGDELFLDATYPDRRRARRPGDAGRGPARRRPGGPDRRPVRVRAAVDGRPRPRARRSSSCMLLADAADGPRGTIVGGMGRVLEALKESGLPVCFAPGVVQLTTVPEHRKVNRIDMGTADKLCAVALAVWDQARRLDVPFDETSFVSVEAGGAFTAVVAVERGAIVDGAGGTCGALGFRALGAMDGELAYLLRDFPKDVLASGGAAWIAGDPRVLARRACASPRRSDRPRGGRP